MAFPPLPRRWIVLICVALAAMTVLLVHPPSKPISIPFATSFTSHDQPQHASSGPASDHRPPTLSKERPYKPVLSADSKWRSRPQQNPVASLRPLPSGPAMPRPKVQTEFGTETAAERTTREARLDAIRAAFKHTWEGYRQHAWTHDELLPITGQASDPFGGWAATMVDSLDTLWIMNLTKEFEEAVDAVGKIDFSVASVKMLNVFETSIRFLGGLLSAYDLSGKTVLLDKAAELAEMLYVAFDTPNRMPNSRWDWQSALANEPFEAGHLVVSSEIGSFTLEFIRLSQLTGDNKYYDAVARITDLFAAQQDHSNLPGLWPVFVNPVFDDVSSGNGFSIGAMADSLYEYLPKTWALLGGREAVYRTMYEKVIAAAQEHLFYRPLNPWKPGKLWLSGDRTSDDAGNGVFDPKTQHLTCFAGGMVGLGAKLFHQPEQMALARGLTDGCIWAYRATATGIAPEIFTPVACDRSNPADTCAWQEARWLAVVAGASSTGELRYSGKHGHAPEYPPDPAGSALDEGARIAAEFRIPQGFMAVPDRKYQLRPEALESVFLLYRMTSDRELRENGWDMFEAIARHTQTPLAFAGLVDVTDADGQKRDRMESFWPAETLKYAYLLFTDEEVISLDDWVFNTEAHPLRLPAV